MFVLFGKFQIHVKLLPIILQGDEETKEPGPGQGQSRQEVGGLCQAEVNIDKLELKVKVSDRLLDDVDNELSDGCYVEDDEDGRDETGGQLPAGPPFPGSGAVVAVGEDPADEEAKGDQVEDDHLERGEADECSWQHPDTGADV